LAGSGWSTKGHWLLAPVGRCNWLLARVGEGHWPAMVFWLPGVSGRILPLINKHIRFLFYLLHITQLCSNTT